MTESTSFRQKAPLPQGAAPFSIHTIMCLWRYSEKVLVQTTPLWLRMDTRHVARLDHNWYVSIRAPWLCIHDG